MGILQDVPPDPTRSVSSRFALVTSFGGGIGLGYHIRSFSSIVGHSRGSFFHLKVRNLSFAANSRAFSIFHFFCFRESIIASMYALISSLMRR